MTYNESLDFQQQGGEEDGGKERSGEERKGVEMNVPLSWKAELPGNVWTPLPSPKSMRRPIKKKKTEQKRNRSNNESLDFQQQGREEDGGKERSGEERKGLPPSLFPFLVPLDFLPFGMICPSA